MKWPWQRKSTGGVPFTMTPDERRVAENFVVGHWPDTPYGLTDAELRDVIAAAYDHPDGWEGFCAERGLRRKR